MRTPGDFLARDGGVHFKNAWDQIDGTVNRVYIESWNEYDEGTGIYAGDTGAPYIHPGSNNTNTDTWSSTNNPYEYIETNARGAAKFNDYPRLDSRFLWNDAPGQLAPNGMDTVHVVIRNEGNEKWSDMAGFSLKQAASDPVQFALNEGSIVDSLHDIPTFGGIFRGRPIRFDIPVQAPLQTGNYTTHWQMVKNDTVFGETLTLNITVSGNPVNLDDRGLLNHASLNPVAINPVSGLAEVSFELPVRASDLNLAVYDLLGKELVLLADGPHAAGRHSLSLDTKNLNAGLYFCVLDLPNGNRLSRKMLVQ
ncbi:MAG: NBR1-Ig-like domain-containing protein [Bacteroidia bacterium]